MKLLSKALTLTTLGASLMLSGQATAATATSLSLAGAPALQMVSGGSFDDVFSFTVSSITDVLIAGSSSAFTITLGSLPLPPITIPALTFGGYHFASANGGAFASSATEYSQSGNSFSFLVSDLAPGSYLFSIHGTTGDAGMRTFSANGAGTDIGTYAIAAQAVPEPGAWAMLLAGMGMVGATIRRRTKR